MTGVARHLGDYMQDDIAQIVEPKIAEEVGPSRRWGI